MVADTLTIPVVLYEREQRDVLRSEQPVVTISLDSLKGLTKDRVYSVFAAEELWNYI